MLSLFPGIGLLDRAFEEAGYCVVRGPDVLWGGDVRAFHAPTGRFDGVIGGPPCVGESALANMKGGRPGFTMRDEFLRIVSETAPRWWVMEAVIPHVDLECYRIALSPRWLGEQQSRRRWFHSNLNLEPHLEVALFEHPVRKGAVLAHHAVGRKQRGRQHNRIWEYTIEDACELQGLPRDFLVGAPFTKHGKSLVIGNGVPLPMGRAIARAVRRAMEED